MSFKTNNIKPEDGWVDITTAMALVASTVYEIKPNDIDGSFWIAKNASIPTNFQNAAQVLSGQRLRFKAEDTIWCLSESDTDIVAYELMAGEVLGGGGGSSEWGQITGTLADQVDLQDALNAKMPTGVAGTEIVDAQSWYTQTSFAANVYTITSSSGANPTSLAAGSRGSFIALNANDGASPVQITIGDNTYTLKASYGDLVANDIVSNSLVSFISDGTELKVVKKKELIFNDRQIIKAISFTNEMLSLANSTPALFVNPPSESPLNIEYFHDKMTIFSDLRSNPIVLPDMQTGGLGGVPLPKNFSFTLRYNATTDKVINFQPQPNEIVIVNKLAGQAAGQPQQLTVAGDSCAEITVKISTDQRWLVSIKDQKASATVAGVAKFADVNDYGSSNDKIATPAGINNYYKPLGAINSSYQQTPKGLLKTVRHTIASLVAGGQSAVIPLTFDSTVPFMDAAKLIVEAPSITNDSGAMLTYSMSTPTITGFNLTIFNNGTSTATNIIFTVNVYESIL